MKRFICILAAVCAVALLSGCSLLSRAVGRVLPRPTPAAVQTAEQIAPGTAAPEMSVEPVQTPAATETPAPTDNPVVYSSAGLGITFQLPASWAGRFRVQEGDGYLCVYFAPEEPIEDGMGKFFTVMKMTSGDEDTYFDDSKVFKINGVSFVFGTPTDMTYSEGDPQYDTFVRMQQDLPAIFQSIKAVG